MPGITLHIRIHRSSNDFVLTSLDSSSSDEKFVAIFERASLFATKMVVKDSVRMFIEKTLVSGPAHYPYIETINKHFIISAGQNSFVRENNFGTEPVRRLTFFLTTNEQFRGTRNADAFHYRPFGLQRLELTREKGSRSQVVRWTSGMGKCEPITTQYNHLALLGGGGVREETESLTKTSTIISFWFSI